MTTTMNTTTLSSTEPDPAERPTRLLQGASNFRDLGGLVGLDQRRVRRGRVYRSDHLAGLTPDDLRTVLALGLTHRIDFRGAGERQALPSDVPGVTALSLAIEPTVVHQVNALLQSGQAPTQAETVELMCQTYRLFALKGAPVYARFFQHLLEQTTPLVFHCTAGKDRTGFAAALLLSALGVPREDIVHDYLLTNRLYVRSSLVESHGPDHVMDVLWSVQPVFLEAAFKAIDEEHGGLDNYLAGPMGLGGQELQRLRDSLLEA
ncbi:MAG: tyrosine-protein phosphatase [Hydrogenophaga sp.]